MCPLKAGKKFCNISTFTKHLLTTKSIPSAIRHLLPIEKCHSAFKRLLLFASFCILLLQVEINALKPLRIALVPKYAPIHTHTHKCGALLITVLACGNEYQAANKNEYLFIFGVHEEA